MSPPIPRDSRFDWLLRVALIALVVGVWLGRLGTIDLFRRCATAADPETAVMACEDWMFPEAPGLHVDKGGRRP